MQIQPYTHPHFPDHRSSLSFPPERPGVEVHRTLALVPHPVVHDPLDVLHDLGDVLAHPGEDVRGTAAQGLHVLEEVSLEHTRGNRSGRTQKKDRERMMGHVQGSTNEGGRHPRDALSHLIFGRMCPEDGPVSDIVPQLLVQGLGDIVTRDTHNSLNVRLGISCHSNNPTQFRQLWNI